MSTEQLTNGPGVPYGVQFINPQAIIDRLDFRSGMKVADFGCGTGYFTFPLAQKVGSNGVIYALDILKEKLEAIDSQAKLGGLTNIITKRVNLEMAGGSKLPDSSVDWVLLINMLFQNSDKNTIIVEAKRVLKPEGRILVIEWQSTDSSVGPKTQLRVSQDSLANLAGSNGLIVNEELDVNNFHYGLVLSK